MYFDIGDPVDDVIVYEKPLWDRYYHMIDRCYNSKCKAFKDYGERGIEVCEEWKNSKQSFFRWSLNNGYSTDLELDRIDNNKGYSPNNCRYVTRKVNRSNRRDSKES